MTTSDDAHFLEVDPAHTSPAFRAYIVAGVRVLRESGTEVGSATWAFLARGGARLDELTDLTRADFEHVRRTVASYGTRLGADAYHHLHDRDGHALRLIRENLSGYQWDSRIYVKRGLAPEALARTLVHEVNHVLNASEEHYRGDTAALREEYRATYVEKLFAGVEMTAARCAALKVEVVKRYGLAQAKADEIPDVPPGILVPPG